MEARIDTGKLTLELADNGYLHLVIYDNDEIRAEDMPPVIAFLDQFDQPLPALIERRGRYSLSVQVRIALLQQAKKRLSAAAYVDRNHMDSALSKIAKHTYLRHTRVKSFNDRESAEAWLIQFVTEADTPAATQD